MVVGMGLTLVNYICVIKIKKSLCKKQFWKNKTLQEEVLRKKLFCYNEQTKLLEGREFGCLEFGPC